MNELYAQARWTWSSPPTRSGRRCPPGSTCSPPSCGAPARSRTPSACAPASIPPATTWSASPQELTALRAEVVSDPLAFWHPRRRQFGARAAAGRTPRATTARRAPWRTIRREIDAVLKVRQDSEQRLMRLRDVLSRADRTLAEARTARGEVLAKIAASEVPAVSGPPTALQEQLAAAAEYRRHSQWHRLSPLLESPGAAGRGRTAARPRVVDGGHRAAGGPRRAARPSGRVQGEGGPARPGGGPAADRAVRRGAPDAVERALRSARRPSRRCCAISRPPQELLTRGAAAPHRPRGWPTRER